MKNILWIFLLASGLAQGRAPIPALTAVRWRQDVGYFANEIATKHRDPYHFISKSEFSRAVSDLQERIPSMKDYEVVVGVQHLAALMGDGHTFLNVTDFRRETEAIVVGEPTGARPNGYQENYWFTLPHSKLRISCSMLKYRFQPGSETDAVFPDQRIDPSWRLFDAGKDAALQWILAKPD